MARTVKASIVVMSHLSDIGIECGFNDQMNTIRTRANFAKYIILETGGNLNQEIDADAMYKKFKEKTPVMG